MDLSIIIINWNSIKYLRDLLEILYNTIKTVNYEIIVADNASYDGCEKLIQDEYPEVKFIQNKYNYGFSRANNIAASYSKGKILLFLNPDTKIIGPAIKNMHEELDTLDAAGIVGCRLVNKDFTLQTNSIQPYPTILNQLLDLEFLKMKTSRLSFWGIKPLFQINSDAEEVQVISGACLMIKRDIFEDVNGFSEEYFMYGEDIDLCFKVKRAGYRIYYLGNTSIVHLGGGSTRNRKDNYIGVALMRESVYVFMKKTRGKFVARLFRLSMMLSSIVRLIIIWPLIKVLKMPSLEEIMRKWVMILRWSFGMEKNTLSCMKNNS